MSLLHDIRAAGRQFVVQPGWTAAAIVCLAIASGANAAAFSLLDALLLRPLPFDRPEQLVMVALRDPLKTTVRPFSLREYLGISGDADGVAQLLARTYVPVSLAAEDGAEMAQAELVSADYFDTLRVKPLAGRFFDPAADRPGGAVTGVLSHALWQRRFGADPSIVGRTMRVNGRPVAIVGIAPARFVGAMRLVAADLWLPAAIYPDLARSADAASVPIFGVMGRLADGTTIEQARARLTSIAARDLTSVTAAPAVVVTPAAGFGVPVAIQGAVFTITGFVYGLAALLTVVACTNVAALVLARGSSRTREIAVRLSLGASSTHIARQLLAEGFALAIAGCAAGTIVALWLVETAVARLTTPFQYVNYALDVHPDARVFACCAGATGIAALLCSLAPIRHAARVDIVDLLKGATGGSPSPASKRTFNVMVSVQFAVSTMLLVAATTLVRTYINAQALQATFATAGLVAVTIDVDQVGVDRAAGVRLLDLIGEKLSALPGIDKLAVTRDPPFGSPPAVTVTPETDGIGPFESAAMVVSDAYFDTVGLSLRQGRRFSTADAGRPPVAIVDEAAAQRLAPHETVIGRRFRASDGPGDPVEVIGVVADAARSGPSDSRKPTIYRPFSQASASRLTILMHASGGDASTFEGIRRTVREVEPDLSIVDLRTVEQLRERANADRRIPATILSAVGLLALLLSAVGLYGVIAYAVRDRLRELGIRLALGAQRASIRRLVFRQGSIVVAAGLGLGVAGSLGAAALMRRAVFGIATADPVDVAAVALVLAAAAVAALYWPARWASQVEPAETLRG